MTAAERFTRVLYAAIGLTSLAFAALSLPSLIAQAWQPEPVRSVIAWSLVFGLPVVLGLLSRRAPLPLLRIIALSAGVVFLFILGFWVVVRRDQLPPGADIPWAITLTGVPVLAVAAATRARVAWVYLLLVCTLSGLVRAATSTDAHPAFVGIEDALYSILLVGVFLGLMTVARRNATSVDAATDALRHGIATAAAVVARKRERLAIDALVHDSVISTLLMAGRGGSAGGIPVEVLSAHAADTLVRLDAVRGLAADRSVSGDDVARALHDLVASLAPDAAQHSDLHGTRSVPAPVLAAVLGAAGEAVRNSVAAAGSGRARPVHRTVTARSLGDGIRVAVHDDGVGFDPALVPAERLGISRSIVARMHGIAGGTARVRSSPGTGTDVVISWRPVHAPTTAASERVVGHSRAIVPTALLVPSRAVAVALLVFFIAVHALLAVGDGVVSAIAVIAATATATAAAPTATAAATTTATATAAPTAAALATILGLVLISAAAAWLTFAVTDPVSRRAVAVFAPLALGGAAFATAAVAPVDTAPFAHWSFGAVTLLLVMLAARGRPLSAWLGYAALSVIAIAWALVTGLPVTDGVALVIRHAGTLLAGTVFAVGLGRSTRALAVLNRERAAGAATAAGQFAAIAERESALARVNLLARPALERLAGATAELDPAFRAECLIVEATLRDAIRARTLFVEPLIGAARAARARGVDVTLLDDSGDDPAAGITAVPVEALAAIVVAHVAAQLDTLASGRLTARLLPPGRDAAATIVIESSGHRMLTVTSDGHLAAA